MTTSKILARAAALGIEPPVYSQADCPQVWQAWEDRVLLAESQFQRGQDAAIMIREAQIYGGRQPPTIPEAQHRQANLRLDDFFGRVIPGIILEQSEPQGTA